MAEPESGGVICRSDELLNEAAGRRFSVITGGEQLPAFVVRHRGRVYAYRNICAHRGVPLDWDSGRFFDITGSYLICATHGALYDPETGHCISGPCRGLGLVPVAVTEADGKIRLAEADGILLSEPTVTG